jgi:hypothetical protein
VFGVTLVLLYSASTLYHALPMGGAERVFRALDHSAIYLLVAGTYTPFTPGALRGPWGWALGHRDRFMGLPSENDWSGQMSRLREAPGSGTSQA